MELLRLQNDEGPYLDCYRTATSVSLPDLDEATQTVAAVRRGRPGTGAVPRRCRPPGDTEPVTSGLINYYEPAAWKLPMRRVPEFWNPTVPSAVPPSR